ncbi:Presequence protease 1 chloroplastic/mitochondrial [Dissostichus eleginoides]|uniref:Presequence protease 1 chloroplastic/mitochondrial n=1 Tax=Dissostichus eleginoides TaxID=100907 RepID=A0AAD9BHP0_DISEL|nr:Presequence protease 1 chloroplastic/mitochondrial [Dissostichus eleginoides]
MTGVASCGCGAAAVIGDPLISWTRATQSCALSGETPHLTCGPMLGINDTPVHVPPVQGDLYDSIRQGMAFYFPSLTEVEPTTCLGNRFTRLGMFIVLLKMKYHHPYLPEETS